jgi:hypothetical protein
MLDPHQIECVCDVCGGPGMSTLETSAASWLGGETRHTDPRVCATYLAQRKRQLDEREKALTTQAAGDFVCDGSCAGNELGDCSH